MTEEQTERLVCAVETIAKSFETIADDFDACYKLGQAFYDKLYPVRVAAEGDATVTHLQTDEEKVREAQGDTGETIEEWTGLREQEFIDQERAQTSRFKKK